MAAGLGVSASLVQPHVYKLNPKKALRKTYGPIIPTVTIDLEKDIQAYITYAKLDNE